MRTHNMATLAAAALGIAAASVPEMRTYEYIEPAPADLRELRGPRIRKGSKHSPHEGKREIARRLRQRANHRPEFARQ